MAGAALLASLMLAQVPPAVRLVCYLEPVDRSGELEVRIENPSPGVVDALVRAELVLEPGGRPEQGDPLVPSLSYRAGMDLSGASVAPGLSPARLTIPAKGTKTWRVRAIDLPWHKKLSATRAYDGAFRTVVPPGRYELTLLLQHPASGWWSSSATSVTVEPHGVLSVPVPEGR